MKKQGGNMGYRSGRYGRGNGDPTGSLIIIGLFIAIFIGIGIYHHFRKKKIREYCERNRLTYEDSPASMTGYSEPYDILNHGNSSYYSAGMYGTRGDIELNIIDYTYVTGYGKNRSQHNYTLCQLYREGTQFPCFFVRDENSFFDSIGSMLGGQDIDFAEDKTFSDKFVLQGVNESDVRRFFNNKVRRAFVRHHQKGNCYESKGQCFLLYRSGHCSLEGRIAMLNNALKIFNEISTTDYENSMDDIPRNPKYYG